MRRPLHCAPELNKKLSVTCLRLPCEIEDVEVIVIASPVSLMIQRRSSRETPQGFVTIRQGRGDRSRHSVDLCYDYTLKQTGAVCDIQAELRQTVISESRPGSTVPVLRCGTVRSTLAYALSCRRIFHTAYPFYPTRDDNNSKTDLQRIATLEQAAEWSLHLSYRLALEMSVDLLGARTIAFQAALFGYDFPAEKAFYIALGTARQFLETYASLIDRITFCCCDCVMARRSGTMPTSKPLEDSARHAALMKSCSLYFPTTEEEAIKNQDHLLYPYGNEECVADTEVTILAGQHVNSVRMGKFSVREVDWIEPSSPIGHQADTKDLTVEALPLYEAPAYVDNDENQPKIEADPTLSNPNFLKRKDFFYTEAFRSMLVAARTVNLNWIAQFQCFFVAGHRHVISMYSARNKKHGKRLVFVWIVRRYRKAAHYCDADRAAMFIVKQLYDALHGSDDSFSLVYDMRGSLREFAALWSIGNLLGANFGHRLDELFVMSDGGLVSQIHAQLLWRLCQWRSPMNPSASQRKKLSNAPIAVRNVANSFMLTRAMPNTSWSIPIEQIDEQ